MNSKLEIYDFLTILVPGIVATSGLLVAFPQVGVWFSGAGLPEAFAVVALSGLSIMTGSLIQALASVIEPFLIYRGGRPSEVVFTKGLGDRYLPLTDGQRIKAKLEKREHGESSDQSLFLYAMQIARGASNSRVTRFNAHYAYHRSLLVTLLLGLLAFTASFANGVASQLGCFAISIFYVTVILVTVLVWHRTRQRGLYFVREVVLTAERELDLHIESSGGTE